MSMLFLISCSKDDSDDVILNATAYIEDERLPVANIAFIPSNRTDIIKDENSVEAYFKTNPNHSAKGVYTYKEYLEKGVYIIVIQLNNNASPSIRRAYTYKTVSTVDSAGFGNIMQFKNTNGPLYQQWKEKE